MRPAIKASTLVRWYGWSGSEREPIETRTWRPAIGGTRQWLDYTHQFTRNADGTVRPHHGIDLRRSMGKVEASRYCVNAAVCQAECRGSFLVWSTLNTSTTQRAVVEQCRAMAQQCVNGPIQGVRGQDEEWLEIVSVLAAWNDQEGRTADEVIALLEGVGL